MRNFLIRTLKFGLFALVYFFIIGSITWISIGFTHGFLSNRIAELKEIKNPDILFLGSSRCYRGFDTRIFAKQNIESFNLGSSAQSLEQSYLLLNKYLDQVNPKTVILEVSGRSLEADGIESTLDLLANVPLDMDLGCSAMVSRNPRTYLALMSAIVRRCLSIAPITRSNSRDHYVSGGFVERVDPTYRDEKVFIPNSLSFKIREKNKESLDQIVELTKKRGITLFLVQVPILPERYQTHSNRAEIDQFFAKRGEYLNFNKRISILDADYFYDSSHLNNRGVSVFNESLLDALQDKGLFHL